MLKTIEYLIEYTTILKIFYTEDFYTILASSSKCHEDAFTDYITINELSEENIKKYFNSLEKLFSNNGKIILTEF